MEFRLDTSIFDEKFKKLAKEVMPEKFEEGMGRAMLLCLGDCIMEVPTVPIKEGWLRGSGSIFAQNKLVGVSTHGKPGMATMDYSEPIRPNEVVGHVLFSTPYAARLHEGITFHFTEPSSGPKYLESKLLKNGQHYLQTIKDTILEAEGKQ